MLDKNGVKIETGDMVVVSGGYFKADNGYFMVMHSPGDANWLGNDHSLCRCSKKGKLSVAKYRTAFWPLMVTVNNEWERYKAKRHNLRNATIEVVKKGALA